MGRVALPPEVYDQWNLARVNFAINGKVSMTNTMRMSSKIFPYNELSEISHNIERTKEKTGGAYPNLERSMISLRCRRDTCSLSYVIYKGNYSSDHVITFLQRKYSVKSK